MLAEEIETSWPFTTLEIDAVVFCGTWPDHEDRYGHSRGGKTRHQDISWPLVPHSLWQYCGSPAKDDRTVNTVTYDIPDAQRSSSSANLPAHRAREFFPAYASRSGEAGRAAIMRCRGKKVVCETQDFATTNRLTPNAAMRIAMRNSALLTGNCFG